MTGSIQSQVMGQCRVCIAHEVVDGSLQLILGICPAVNESRECVIAATAEAGCRRLRVIGAVIIKLGRPCGCSEARASGMHAYNNRVNHHLGLPLL
jgi:hypothetical protein